MATTPSAVLTISETGVIRAHATGNGGENWVAKLPANIAASPAINGTTMAVGLADGRIRTVSLVDGKTLDDLRLKHPVSALAFDKGELYWGDGRGNVFSYDVTGGNYRWKLKHGGRVSALKVFEKNVITASADNFVYMIDRDYGNIRWKKRQTNRITAVERWNGGKLIVLDTEGRSASVIDSNNGRLISELPSASEVFIHGTATNDLFVILSSFQSVSGYGVCGTK